MDRPGSTEKYSTPLFVPGLPNLRRRGKRLRLADPVGGKPDLILG
jgi:hypothetical protein